jgi:hypothetical protein
MAHWPSASPRYLDAACRRTVAVALEIYSQFNQKSILFCLDSFCIPHPVNHFRASFDGAVEFGRLWPAVISAHISAMLWLNPIKYGTEIPDSFPLASRFP